MTRTKASQGRLRQPRLPEGAGRFRAHPHALRAEGYEVAATYEAADLVVVNTCGFIDSAVDESLDAIGEALAENGKVIVTGCLGAQPQRILDRHPQVLKITGPQRYEEVDAAVHEHLPPRHEPFLDLCRRRASSSRRAITRT